MYNKRSPWIVCLIMLFIVVLSGCSDEPSAKHNSKQEENRNGIGRKADLDDDFIKNIVPITVSDQEFAGIKGWLNDQTIVYLTDISQNFSTYTYDIFSGKTSKMYESEIPIVSIYISPSKERMLIHSSPGPNEASITILDNDGNILAEKLIMSSEITFEWNPFNEDIVLVSAFNEMWEFSVYEFNIQSNELKDSRLTQQPFAFWLTEDEFVYLDWDKNAPALVAPVVKQKINEFTGEKMDLQNVFHLRFFNEMLLTLSVDKNQQENAVYTLFSKKFKSLKTFMQPQLTMYSDWLVPYHDYNQRKKLFLTFRPLHNGEFDTYKKGFQLVQYDLNSDKETVLLDGMDNKPVSFSPDGKFLLYGQQFEEIINLHTKEIISLIKE